MFERMSRHETEPQHSGDEHEDGGDEQPGAIDHVRRGQHGAHREHDRQSEDDGEARGSHPFPVCRLGRLRLGLSGLCVFQRGQRG